MDNKIKITFETGNTEYYPAGISILELSKIFQVNKSNPIIAAKINNVCYRLDDKVYKDSTIIFIDNNDLEGHAMYKSGLKFVLYVAVKELFGPKSDVIFYNSIDKGVYTKIICDEEVNAALIQKIKLKTDELIAADLPIAKQLVKNHQAIDYHNAINETEKAGNVENTTNDVVTLYRLKNYNNYFYTDMPTSTGVLKQYDLTLVNTNHIVLRYPTPRSNDLIPEYKHYPKTLESFEKHRNWLETINVPYLANLNVIVANCKIKEFILMNHIITENQFYKIAENIANQNKINKIKAIFIAGPSSSGKTTSSKKIAIHLKTFGLNSFLLSADDFYKERLDTPKLPNGEFDFESIEALDLELLKTVLNKLMNFEEIQIPSYNFFTGKKEFKNNPVKLNEKDVIIIEGLHCMNNQITDMISKESQYKIYISPFPGLNIDRHNYISSVDLRLIRRIVRDNVYRGYKVEKTMGMWQTVREGEEKHVFPYQDQADEILNTALIYEIGVLRVFAEPLLSSVPVTSIFYQEARRLLGFLRGFFPISPEYVSRDTVLREFIGDSIFS